MSSSFAPRTDRRPALVICAYDVEDGSWDAVADLGADDGWSPAGVRIVTTPADRPETLAATLSGHLAAGDCRALLLVGRTGRSDAFRVQTRAENRTPDGKTKLSHTGPSLARSTAPVADMVRALTEAGFGAGSSSEGEDDVGGFLLYSVLTGLPDDADAPAVGLLRAPPGATPDRMGQAVRVAASAIARHLSPLPRYG